MRFRLIEAERAQHSVSRLCEVLGVTRAGFYAWKRRGPSERERSDRELSKLVERIHSGSRETYGVPRVHAELREEHGVRISRKRVARLMRRLGMEGVSRRGKRSQTTRRAQEAPAAADIVRRRFRAPGPNRLWLADITYVPTWEGYLFLAVVIDCFSRRCVGWSMRDDLRSELVLDALGMAVTGRRPKAGVTHHSDSETAGVWLGAGRFDPHSDRLRRKRIGGLAAPGRSDPHSDRPVVSFPGPVGRPAPAAEALASSTV